MRFFRTAELGLLCALTLAGCEATPPSRPESATANLVKHRITVRNKRQKNPLRFTPQTLADGKEAFGHYCVVCHGNDGQNTGVPFLEHMAPPVPSLASAEVQTYTDGQLKWILDNGIFPSGMPGSKGTLSDDELWSIVMYLRHLPPAGSLGTPEIYTH